jgi:hypothetical protein
MDSGELRLESKEEITVIERIDITGEATLDTELGGTERGGFGGFGNERFVGMEVSFVRIRAAAESAEGAADDAYVGEIEIAIDDVGDGIAQNPAAELVSDFDQSEKIGAIHGREKKSFAGGHFAAIKRLRKDGDDWLGRRSESVAETEFSELGDGTPVGINLQKFWHNHPRHEEFPGAGERAG